MRGNWDLQHPDITAAEMTGYPRQYPSTLTCDWCYDVIPNGEEYYDIHGEVLCADCLEECKCIAGEF